jgi:outer membrane protein OmpA-like peptidoglycan-associated protein
MGESKMKKQHFVTIQYVSLVILLLMSFACTRLPARTELGEPKSELFYSTKNVMDQAVSERADEFAPEIYKTAVKHYLTAEDRFSKGKDKSEIRKQLNEAENWARKSIDASQSMQSNFSELIASRDKAIAAKADRMDLDTYKKGDKLFLSVASRVGEGKIEDARQKAQDAIENYRLAELKAIQTNMTAELNKQIREAEKVGADEWAPQTYQEALKLRNDTLESLSQDRYDEKSAMEKAKAGEYSAQKAQFLAQKVKESRGDKSNWEKLFLEREDDLNQIASSVGVQPPDFEKGYQVAVSEIDQAINELKRREQAYTRTLSSKEQALANAERQIREAEKSRIVAEAQIREAEQAKSRISSELQSKESTLESQRLAEQKVRSLQKMFAPHLAEVKLDTANNITLVLRGINFDTGKSNLKSNQYPLLASVKQAIDLFPDRKMIISGHTDFTGSSEFNKRLSLDRARSVMQYMRSLGVDANRMEAIGAGESNPIAPNVTAEGRRLNRRIEVTILSP